jgi:hypothetical protein
MDTLDMALNVSKSVPPVAADSIPPGSPDDQ